MNNLSIGPLISSLLVKHDIHHYLLARFLGLSQGELHDLLIADDVGCLHLIRISEAIGVDLLPELSKAVDLPEMMAHGPRLSAHDFTVSFNGSSPPPSHS